MDEASIARSISGAFEGVERVVADGNTFFFRGADRKMPFATLVTRDDYDFVSNLNRPNAFRLNVGVRRETYESLFGKPPSGPIGAAVFDKTYDFTAVDQLMPHPTYAQMFWVCVLNPSDETFETVKPLLAEAFELAGRRVR